MLNHKNKQILYIPSPIYNVTLKTDVNHISIVINFKFKIKSKIP